MFGLSRPQQAALLVPVYGQAVDAVIPGVLWACVVLGSEAAAGDEVVSIERRCDRGAAFPAKSTQSLMTSER